MKNNEKGSIFRGENGQNYLFPFILVTILFLMWGFAHSLLDVLNAKFQVLLDISKARSAFVQFSLYIGYFVMGIPAGIIIKKFGYRKGIILGLVIFAIGSFLFYPATCIKAFSPFLIALFIIACGLTCLEAAANPYTTVLGDEKSAARRINLAQSFNGLGWILGPLIGGLFIFSGNGNSKSFNGLCIPYIIVGIIVLLIALLFVWKPLPQISHTSQEIDKSHSGSYSDLFKHKLFIFAVIAQFFYVAAQTGIGSFFINYVIEARPDITPGTASKILAFGGMGLFMLGRISGSYFMKFCNPKKLLVIYACINVLLTLMVILKLGMLSVVCLFATYFFMSIMYPTIFAIGIKGLNENTEKGSSIIVMAVVGGAIIPMVMGRIADLYSMSVGFIVPLICFAIVILFGISKCKN